MRRSDREIRDMDQVREIIRSCDCCRIAFPDENGPYIVPLNFAFTHNNAGHDVFYFHGAKEGRKHQLILRSPTVGFELDRNHAVNVSDRACGYSFRFQSVIGTGVVSPVEDILEKKIALALIMEHYGGKRYWVFSDHEADEVFLFRLVVNEMSGKEHR